MGLFSSGRCAVHLCRAPPPCGPFVKTVNMPPDSCVDETLTKSLKLQHWLDQNQYTRRGILMYERIFGSTYVSVGGEHTTSEFTEKLNLEPNMKVLDIGCGIGGSAFYMARKYGVDVNGVDLSTNMIEIALENRMIVEPAVKHRVQFYAEDAITMPYPESFYNVVYSRDTILHIPDKLDLFKKFYSTLKSGGICLISDYCHGDQEHSERFKQYVAKRDYKLLTVEEYGKRLQQAGFVNVEAIDSSQLMIEMLQVEIEKFVGMKDAFIQEFGEEGYLSIKQGWQDKLVRCKEGDQAWGLFIARKP